MIQVLEQATTTAPARYRGQPLLLRPTEAADALGLSRSTVYELLATGAIESVAIGRSRRIPYAALLTWVDEQRAAQASADRRVPV